MAGICLYRVLLGARISMLVGVTGALVSFAVGIIYGMVAGYVGGQADSIMMRLVDTLYAIPRLIFLLVLITALDPLLRRCDGNARFTGADRIFENHYPDSLPRFDRVADHGPHRPRPRSSA